MATAMVKGRPSTRPKRPNTPPGGKKCITKTNFLRRKKTSYSTETGTPLINQRRLLQQMSHLSRRKGEEIFIRKEVNPYRPAQRRRKGL